MIVNIIRLTGVSAVGLFGAFVLNLPVQTLVGSFPGMIVPIPLHTVNIRRLTKKKEVSYEES